MLRCSATTAVALPHLPVSLACFGSGLFNELGKHMTNWRQREREREGREEKRVCGGNHMVSHTSKAVSTQKVQAPSTPQHRLLIRSVAVRAVRLLSRTRISSRSSSHASEERAHPHLLPLLVVLAVVVVQGHRQPAVQHSEAHSTKQGDVGRADNVPQALHGRKRASMDACEGPGPRGLVPAMNANGPVSRRHTQVGEVLH